MDAKDKQITEIPSSPSEQNNNRTTNDASTNKEQEIETNEIDAFVFEQQSQNTQNRDIGALTKPSKTTQFSRSAPELFAPIPLWAPSKSVGSLDDINQEMLIAKEKKNITQKNFGSRIQQSKPIYAISSALNETEQKWDKKLVSPTLKKHDSGSPLTVTKRMFNSKSDITSRASKQNISVDEYSQQQLFSQQINDDTVGLSPMI